MRITERTIFDSALRNLQRNREALTDLRSQVATGKRINSIADDPSGLAQVLSLRRGLERVDQFQRNIDSARSSLEQTESNLGAASNLLIRARELAVSADVETSAFPQIQTEVEALFEQMLQISNARSDRGYLFAGFSTNAVPFTATLPFNPAGASPAVSYNGDIQNVLSQVGESQTLKRNLTGAEVFTDDVNQDGTPEPGRVDIFKVLGDLRDALRTQNSAGILSSIGELDTAIDQINTARGIVGTRSNRLDITSAQLQDLRISIDSERSSIEDTDLVKAATDLANRETSLQASLAVTARVLQSSLVDFLR